MYHDVEPAARERKYKHFYVLARDLDWQMGSLKKAGYTPISFRTLADFYKGITKLPTKPIVLTFDDGYKNVIELAHPIMESYRFHYTVFVVTGKMGGCNDWVLAEGYETSPLMDWDDIAAIQVSGLADIQPHTVTHRPLTDLTRQEMDDELRRSKDTVDKMTGSAADTICYPWGKYNSDVLLAAKSAGFKLGVTTDFGRVRADDDLLKLPRISIHHVPPLSFDYGVASMNYWWKIRSRVDKRPPQSA